ncbi:MAG: intradiol ring-cleavage dioxygenase [Acidimicrobiia bacterium]
MAPEHDHIEEPSNEELRLLSRRSAIKSLGGAGLAVIAACATSSAVTTTAAAAGSTTSSGATATTAGGGTTITTFGGAGSVLIPEETAGPYPLDLSGDEVFVRTDITEGRPGVPLALTLTLVNASADCAPIANARVDLWHCDTDGVYSGYSQPGSDTTGETFCRGIQVTDGNGQVTFQTIYPGWYQGRITHIHFQVFLDNGLAATSQIAFPPEVTDAVYVVEPYAAKGANTPVPTYADDNLFSDGTQYQLAAATGDPVSGYAASLLVGMEV